MYRKMMCLHLLPHGKIEKVFDDLRIASRDINDRIERTLVRKLFHYVEETWIPSDPWSPEAWSVHMQEVTFTFI
jgi:hypothetical protein